MELKWGREKDFERMDEVITFSGRLTLSEIENLNLDELDRKLLDDCGSSNKAEDWLLALETLFRRQRGQTPSIGGKRDDDKE